MAGIIRIVLGALFLLAGLLFLLTIIGFLIGALGIIIGIVLLASGISARGDAERMERQQRQTNLLLQQQLQVSAMQANRPGSPPQYPSPAQYPNAPPPQYVTSTPPNPNAVPAERYCSSCGGANARAAAFCQKCGSPLPPPP
jgi:hypothetical protein